MTFLARLSPLAVSLLFVASAASAQSAPGWTYTMNITTDSGDGSRRSSIAMRQQITARNLRMEFVQVSGMPAAAEAEGMYNIFDVVDSTMTIVMPGQHMATVTNYGLVRKALPAALTATEQRLTRSDLEDLGAGERILGHATRHVRLTTTGTIDVTVMGESCTGRLESVSEMWIAPDVDLGPATAAAGQHLGAMSGMGSAPSVPKQTGAAPATLPKGTSLRSVTKISVPDQQGKTTTVTVRTDMVELSQGALEASLFAVPADFKKMDTRAMMASMPAGMLDSAMRSGAATGASAVAKAMCHSGGTD